ncbi:MAG: M20/M25/M40 family metallo-hydrolase [Pirellulales bacterium]|nr:M20/M25/M40 family metallo-hydrolase [Pirellulales bacterium]
MMAIPGMSRQEGQIVQYVVDRLRSAGADASCITTDQAHTKTLLPGEIGNLVFKLPGTFRAPRRLLMAHLDTVPLCVGSKPLREGGIVRSGDPRTGIGADNRAGAAVVLCAALEILERKLPHPPLTFFWPVQEELGLQGVRHASLGLLGRPQLAFNWDGGSSEKLTVGATGAFRLTISIRGLASHAGGAPEYGVSAIAIAGLAIADLHRRGWHGDVRHGKRRGTSNIGFIEGGGATNVVTDHVVVRAEARSHDPKFRLEIATTIEQAFCDAAAAVRNVAGACGQATIERRHDYEAFRLADDEPCVVAAEAAVRAVGEAPLRATSNGGLDANWMTERGVPTVTLGCGQANVHTVAEQLLVPEFEQACRIALRLATGAQ